MKIFILLTCLVFAFPTAAASNLVLAIGASSQVKVPPGSTIRVSNSKVVRVQDQGSSLLVTGRKPGQAVISHARGAIRVDVVSSAVAKTYLQFREAIQAMQGLELDVHDNQVLVTGELLRLSDWLEFIELQKTSGGSWRMQAEIDPGALPKVRSYLKEVLRGYAAGTYRLQLAPFPRLEVSKNIHSRLEQDPRLRNAGLTLIKDQGFLELSPAIRLKLTLAEVQRGASERLGVKLQDGQTVQLLPRFKLPTEFAATIGFLADKGLAKLLATPSLTARSGREAEFLAGGEFAVRTSSFHSREVSWKRHGLWMKFKPTIDPRGVVQLEVNTEFSAPDYSNAVEGIPSLRTSKAASAIDVKLGSTVMLSGMIRTSEGFSASGPVGLSDIPILGRLFRSEDFNLQRSELLIFVTPELVPIETDEDVVMPKDVSTARSKELQWKSID